MGASLPPRPSLLGPPAMLRIVVPACGVLASPWGLSPASKEIMGMFDKFKTSKMNMCAVCGKIHEELPDIGSLAPIQWRDEYQAQEGCFLDTDLCIIENRDYFIRGVIEIPIIKTKERFGWGVWISQKKENFEIYQSNFDSGTIGPFFGWLCTKIGYYQEDTINLKTKAHFHGNGLRPTIEIGPCDHELYASQRDGITMKKA
jgi:hypothetical protein